MNHREEPQLPGRRRQALCLLLLLTPALGLDQGHAGPRHGSLFPGCAGPTPYLPVLGAAALRLAEILPPPDLVTHPAAGAPPVPTSAAPAATGGTPARTPPGAPSNTVATAAPSEPAAGTPVNPPAAILPDTARPAIRAEDFLPYFQLPGPAPQPGDVTVMPPGNSPATPPPPSAATYTQTPR